MKKLIFPTILLLLFCVFGCSNSGDQILGPESSDQLETDCTLEKNPAVHDPGDDEGDPDSLIDGFEGPPND